jgi:hypothetical protein
VRADKGGRRIFRLYAPVPFSGPFPVFGELHDPADIEAVLDLIYAPLYFRLLIGHGPLDDTFTDRILDLALNGLSRRPR